MLVWHFSRFILFMATRSCLGVQRAACTTAVAPLPRITATTEQWQNGPEQEETHSTHSWKTTFKLIFPLWRFLTFSSAVSEFMLWCGLIETLGEDKSTTTLVFPMWQLVYSVHSRVHYKSCHAGLVKLFTPRSRDTQHIGSQLLATDKEK